PKRNCAVWVNGDEARSAHYRWAGIMTAATEKGAGRPVFGESPSETPCHAAHRLANRVVEVHYGSNPEVALLAVMSASTGCRPWHDQTLTCGGRWLIPPRLPSPRRSGRELFGVAGAVFTTLARVSPLRASWIV